MPIVYIIILNYKKWEDTLDCLESVFQSSYENYSVIVIDNNSENGSLEYLMQWAESRQAAYSFEWRHWRKEDISVSFDFQSFARLNFIQNNVNAGFAGGMNIALRILQNSDAYLWLLNPDVVVAEDTMAELVSFTMTRPLRSITGATIRSYSGNRDLLFYGGFKVNFFSATVSSIEQTTSVNRLDYISGGCLFTHASNLELLGLLPEEYFLYWEETEWCYLAKQKGFGLYVCTAALCYDKISTVIGKDFKANYYYSRNGLRFVSKFRRQCIPVVLFFVGLRLLKRILSGRWARAKGIYYGTRDFFKMKLHESK